MARTRHCPSIPIRWLAVSTSARQTARRPRVRQMTRRLDEIERQAHEPDDLPPIRAASCEVEMTAASQPAPCGWPAPSVTLGPVTVRDYDVISRWTESKSWVYAGGSRHYLNVDAVRSLIESGRDNFMMVRDRDGRSIGAVT